MEILLLRHGMTKGNLEKKYIGTTDEGLLAQEKDRLLEKSRGGCYPKADMVFTSPMRRCMETAELLYPALEKHFVESFVECDFGLFEGKNYEQLKEEAAYQKWLLSNGTMDFPKGEGISHFKSRCVSGFFEMLSKVQGKMKEERKEGIRGETTVACIVHGGTIMSILEALAVPEKSYFDYQVKNGEGYLCTWKEEKLWIGQYVS